MSNDNLGDRMKSYEIVEAGRMLNTNMPIIARIDGRSFHSFTKGLDRPFDERITTCMVETLKSLIEETNANVGYTQSDEITLIWTPKIGRRDIPNSQIWFNGRIQKMTSQLAALASIYFFRNVLIYLPARFAAKNPTFDARVWNVPSKSEALNCLIWRESDAIKNSISMYAQSHFSQKELHGKHNLEMIDMLRTKNELWELLDPKFKYGTYIKRIRQEVKFTAEEIEKLPIKHAARTNPDLLFERNIIKVKTKTQSIIDIMKSFSDISNTIGAKLNVHEKMIKIIID